MTLENIGVKGLAPGIGVCGNRKVRRRVTVKGFRIVILPVCRQQRFNMCPQSLVWFGPRLELALRIEGHN